MIEKFKKEAEFFWTKAENFIEDGEKCEEADSKFFKETDKAEKQLEHTLDEVESRYKHAEKDFELRWH